MRWQTTAAVLCGYGLLKEFRPSEPYMFVYQNTIMNISAEVLNGDVYPYWTYSYLVALVPVFLLTDLLLYKPVLLLESLSYIAVWLLLIFGRAVWTQQLVELFYGWATATEVGFFAYAYVNVDRQQFSRVTVWTRAALQGGRCLSYLLSELIIILRPGSYLILNYLSLGSLCLTFFFALVLPWVGWEEVVRREASHRERLPLSSGSANEPASYRDFARSKFENLWIDLRRIYSDAFLLKWSLWWAMTTSGNFMISNYIQTLWGHHHSEKAQAYNGLVEAVTPLIAVVVLLLLQLLAVDWNRWGELCLTLAAVADFGLLYLLSSTSNLLVMYATYMVFRVLYQAMITISQFNLADRMVVQSYGLVFGFNTLVALALQAIMTIVVVDKRGLGLEIQPQFRVYAFYHLSIAAVFLLAVLYRMLRKLFKKLRFSAHMYPCCDEKTESPKS
ncbi:hypothetical protein QR680_005507 [Steinernema hermaphroditum]|uniref:Reduced folate carrier n=1 Tax=Steinernema hermaphroditum TaxID=289476 RepID=A0AA39LVS8_9BILA|nr:hypothetical protein QR680_005507 [Steinernema hermaphroditum]